PPSSSTHHPPRPPRYTLSLHDALPISTVIADNGTFTISNVTPGTQWVSVQAIGRGPSGQAVDLRPGDTTWTQIHGLPAGPTTDRDRKSTRLNSSHRTSSYAVFCL